MNNTQNMKIKSLNDSMGVKFSTQVLIKEFGSYDALNNDINFIQHVDDHNEIHFENMSFALALSLGNKTPGPIKEMSFGNGGSTVNGLGEVTYLPPNTIGASADLYSPTYTKIVDDNNTANLDPANNKMIVSHVTGNLFSDLIVYCLLDFGEPAGQDAFDQSSSENALFVFNEIGLRGYNGNLLTHIIFNPIQKSANRLIQIKYTLRIQIV